MVRTLRLVVQYDGTGLSGFQGQRGSGRPTVQEALESALGDVLGHPARVVSAGRTDAGVHASGQVVHLRTPNPIPAESIPRAASCRLPPGIRVASAEEVPPSFHARRDATSRIYCYHLLLHSRPSALIERFSWWVGPMELDVAAMEEAARGLVGRRSFGDFGSPPGERGSTWRTLYGCRLDSARLGRSGARILRLCFESDAYLYRMVRRMVGALVNVGTGRLDAAQLVRPGGIPPGKATAAPARGLTLAYVHYGPAPAGFSVCGEILDTLLGLWLEWPRD